ncbi:MAG: GNAT family N-acetyltransferase [Prevotella sp.]|nr:GNAT family N-acetyltransferase [Prevotella sp.]
MKYCVAETDRVVGGIGIASLIGMIGVCELQKMYCIPEARGTGISHRLIETALERTQKNYDQCYLETFGNMIIAQKIYENTVLPEFQSRLGIQGIMFAVCCT